MNRCIAGVAVALMLFNGVALAHNVTTIGMGLTVNDAENNALRQAVESTVGVLVDSQTLVNNHQVISDIIYTQSRGFITNYTVQNRQQTINGWQVTINANVDNNPNSRLMTELTRLGIINHRLRNPKIAVHITERSLGHRSSASAGHSAVIKALVDAGFTNVIAGDPSSPWSARGYRDMRLEDMREVARFFGSDILIVGESFSDSIGDVGGHLPNHPRSGMQACRARIEAKMYIVQTGQIIASNDKYGSGADISKAVASRKALSAAGYHVGGYFVEQLLNSGSGNHQHIELVLIGSNFSQINAIQTALERIHGIRGSQLSRYDKGTGVFAVDYDGSPHSLYAELQRTAPVEMILESISYNTISIRLYQT